MARAVVQITLFGLLLASVISLPNKDDWDIYSFHINSTVTGRYATTVIRSRVANRMNESKEIEFHVRIPKNAFISKFKMLIDGQEYDGVVKAKEQAQQEYTHAVSRGQSAGIVSSVGRTLEEFKTSVNVAAHKKVTFELTYEELLKRRLGKYELQIHARPMQPVKDFKVDVHINEQAGITFIEVKGGLSTKALANAITKIHTDKQAWVHFYPTEDQQNTCDSCGDQGMDGDLVISYDVNRDTSLGDIKRSAGYFVHHFAPSSLPRIPKNVVFVIDQSGSMHGKKIRQTRTALLHILNDLAEDDHFGLMSFDSNIFHWRRELVQATKENLDSAKTFAQNIQDRGSTDINKAVLEGAQMLNAHTREGSASILILLTDGDPTSGITNLEQIQSNVRRAIADKFPLYCLGFGFDVNFEFLEKMSLQNNGAARRIYEDSDADLQLKGFYEEVATPLLTDVTMIYVGGTNLTQTNFSQYYNGSEIVVAGQITDNDIDTFSPQVLAISNNKRIVFSNTSATIEPPEVVSDSQMQRVWAYLTVKQLMEKELLLSGPEKDNVKKEALTLSLKYSFVTPLTSMVVTKPPGEETDVLHKPKEGPKPPRLSLHMPVSGGVTRGGVSHVQGGRWSTMDDLYDYGQRTGVSSYHRQRPYLLSRAGQAAGSGRHHPMKTQARVSYHDFIARLLPALPSIVPKSASLDDDIGVQSYPFPATIVPPRATPAPVSHRFLLKSENKPTPLCFDVTGEVHLKLFHHPSRDLSVNGELDSVMNGGFKRIFIHHQTDMKIEVDTESFSVQKGQHMPAVRHIGVDTITVGSLTVIKRANEIEVTDGQTRIVFLIHLKGREKFLWPVLRQPPLDPNFTGILALKPAVYEEVQGTLSPKLQINNQEVDVTGSDVAAHDIVNSPTLSCWLMSAESALQRPLQDFMVT